jgi:hypothetical protein
MQDLCLVEAEQQHRRAKRADENPGHGQVRHRVPPPPAGRSARS